MKKVTFVLLAVFAMTLPLGACDTTQQAGQKQSVGTVIGAVLGGFLGSKAGGGEGQLWATGAGAVMGAILGSEFGKSLDKNDQVMMERTSQASLEHTRTGALSSWSNPDTGHSGTVTPTRTYQKAGGTFCRDFTQAIVIDGETHDATGTACRQSDGSWRIVK